MKSIHGTNRRSRNRLFGMFPWGIEVFQNLDSKLVRNLYREENKLSTSMIIANGTQHATAQHMPTRLIMTVA